MNGKDNSTGRITRRTFAKVFGLSLAGHTAAAGNAAGREASETVRRVVGTSGYGAKVAGKKSERVEKTVDLGSIGDAVVGQFDPATAKELEDTSGIRYVEEDVGVTFPESTIALDGQSGSGSASSGEQLTPWGCERIDAMSLHDKGVTGGGADVAIIDSGIDSDHPDLEANVGEGYAALECDGSAGMCRKGWDDDHSHGTHCAGIVGALDNDRGIVGVSTDVTLHPVKVMTAAGTGSASDIADGIVWAADQGYDVANISLGSDSPSEVIHDAVKYADRNGMLVVAAAGNEGPCSDCLHYPGAFAETLCVGAIDRNDDLADYSSTGEAVDIVGPGTAIPSTVVDGEYRAFSGTSMATPHVAGAAALLVDAGYSPQEARERLLETAEDLGLEETESGAGLVDCEAALGGGSKPGGTVRTGGTEDVEQTSATVGGRITELDGDETVTVAIDYWPDSESADAATRIEVGTRSSAGTFETTLTGLQRDTTYRYRAVCIGEETTATGAHRSFTTASPPPRITVRTDSATEVGATSATFEGAVTELKWAESVTVSFEYWVEGRREETLSETAGAEQTDVGTFSGSVDDLEPGSTHVVRAVATPADGDPVSGDEVTFTTKESTPPAVEMPDKPDAGLNGVTLTGEVTSLGEPRREYLDTGFRLWTEAEGPDAAETLEADRLTAPGPFEAKTIDLDSGATYQCVAYARAPNGEEFVSEQVTFTTEGDSW